MTLNKHLLAALFLVLAFARCGAGGSDSDSGSEHSGASGHDYQVGAHYYLWFPQKFKEGILRSKLNPPQEPALGIYDSSSSTVVEQHISWAKQAGIDFFTLHWSPKNTEFNSVISNSFLRAKNISDIKFCLFYETGELASSDNGGIHVIDAKAKQQFNNDLINFADNYFTNSQYLRVDGKPVLILYLTRTLVGDYAGMIKEGRELLRRRGIELFLLADEIFWQVTGHREGDDTSPNITSEPQTGRIALFDAIFAYNMYEGSLTQHSGYGLESSFISDIDALYKKYLQALPESVSFVPYAMPGYNDRGVRLYADHFAIPRELSAASGETSFFREFINRLVYPYVDARNGLVLITSWNEWSEDTAIEPAADAPFTSKDQSSGGQRLTEGYRYSGYGDSYLNATKELLGR